MILLDVTVCASRKGTVLNTLAVQGECEQINEEQKKNPKSRTLCAVWPNRGHVLTRKQKRKK